MLIMKFFILIPTLFHCLVMSAQNYDLRETELLYSFEVDINKLDVNNTDTHYNLNAILDAEKKRSSKRVGGVALAIPAVVSTLGGVGILIDGETSILFDKKSKNTIGGLFLGLGIVTGTLSVSLFKKSKRKKQDRDIRIRRFNPDWTGDVN